MQVYNQSRCGRMMNEAVKRAGSVLQLLRWQFWLVSIVPMLVGIKMAGGSISIQELLLLIIIFGPCLEGASESINDYFDKDTDKLKYVKALGVFQLSGGTGLIQRGVFSTREVLMISIAMYSLAVILTTTFGSLILLGIVGMYLLIGVVYSAPPIRLKERGIFGPLAVGFSFGGLALYGGFAAIAGRVDSSVLLQSIPLILIITGTFMTHQIADFEADNKANVKTACVRYGPKRTVILSLSFIFSGIILFCGFATMVSINIVSISIIIVLLSVLIIGLARSCVSPMIRLTAIALQTFVSIVYFAI